MTRIVQIIIALIVVYCVQSEFNVNARFDAITMQLQSINERM